MATIQLESSAETVIVESQVVSHLNNFSIVIMKVKGWTIKMTPEGARELALALMDASMEHQAPS